MNSRRIAVFSLIGLAAVLISIFSFTPQNTSTEFGCTPEFWKNNLELWEVVGIDYNDDFDETFGSNYFEPDITLEQAINAEGFGLNHLASSGTAAYLDALVNPYADVKVIEEHVHDNSVYTLDIFISLCNDNIDE